MLRQEVLNFHTSPQARHTTARYAPMQSEGTIFLRYASSNAKKAIRCTRSTPFLSILEQGLEEFSITFSIDNFSSEYALKWQSSLLDCSTCIQFSNVSFGSTLDIVARRSGNLNSHSPVKVCLQEMQNGKRSILMLKANCALILWQVLRLFEAVNGSCVHCKKGFEPRLEAAGSAKIFGPEQILNVQLASLGTNVLLRLSFVPKANAFVTLPELKESAESFLHLEQQQQQQQQPNEVIVEKKQEIENSPSLPLSTGEPVCFTVLEQLPHVESPQLPDSYYEVSLSELKELATSTLHKQEQADKMPLTSHTLRALKRQQEMRSKYSQCTLRIRLPSGEPTTAIDVVFSTEQKIEVLFAFLKEKQGVLMRGAPEDYTFVVPNQVSDLWALRCMTFFDAGLYPGALVVASRKSK
jgi:hypothetical protein